MTKKPFVDFRDIRSRITMEQVLQHYNLLNTFKRSGHNLSGPCPIHGGNHSHFYCDARKSFWNCVGKCCGGDAIDFVVEMERISSVKAASLIKMWFKLD